MTIRQEMHAAAKRAKEALGDSAHLVVQFIHSQLNDDGGFKGRDGKSDLYYTVFGMEGLAALGEEIPKKNALRDFLLQHKNGEGLDLVHLGCLIRCRANLSEITDVTTSIKEREKYQEQMEKFRCEDGGYSIKGQESHGSAYGGFLAWGAYEDMQRPMPDREKLLGSIKSLEAKNGGFANERCSTKGSIPATAAAVCVLQQGGEPGDEPGDESIRKWMLTKCYKQGGFAAGEAAPCPDLLSTATGLHALALLQTDFDDIREQCLDFLDSLWDSRGAFYGSWADKTPDCEYTYYGLLALGNLTEEE